MLLLGIALDLLFGDPNYKLHPVRLIGRLATAMENRFRKTSGLDVFTQGLVAHLFTLAITVGTWWLLIGLASSLHALLGYLVSGLAIWSSIAIKDLDAHGMRIYAHLKAGDIPQARQALAMMVSRDTDESNEQDIIKGTIESLSENINDSIIAPLVFAALLGPLGAIGYRVCNTLDAMWGYRTEKYEQFGKFSAKVDDVLNYIPSRLGAFWIALAGSIRKNSSMRQTLSIVKRDAHKHPSPNSGQCETAMAAVLQIQLGGPCKYHGKMMDRDTIGNGTVALTVTHIAEASQILLTTAALHAVAMIGIRLFL